MNVTPSYIELHRSGALSERVRRAEEISRKCTLCPHRCEVDRRSSSGGRCRSGVFPIVSACHAHFGEEPPLVGRGGSGTIFFTNCNLRCIFCQNYDISQLGHGQEVSCSDLAVMMLTLQERGCHNINFVSPTHMIYPILKSLPPAIERGLKVPLVYNSGGYDSLETLKLLDGVFDLYMPDFKYADAGVALELSGAGDYPEVARKAVEEMHRQVGDLQMNERGIAFRGLLVRHLVLPGNLAGTDRVIEYIAGLSRYTYLNIMDQYRPEYRAGECRGLGRRITLSEYDEALKKARREGLTRV